MTSSTAAHSIPPAVLIRGLDARRPAVVVIVVSGEATRSPWSALVDVWSILPAASALLPQPIRRLARPGRLVHVHGVLGFECGQDDLLRFGGRRDGDGLSRRRSSLVLNGGCGAVSHVDIEEAAVGLSAVSFWPCDMRDPGEGFTFLLLNVPMTASAPARSVKHISAITVGDDATSLQYIISPPTLAMTLSMSAAVVPGTKLLAMTMYGPPAAPLMLISAAPPTALASAAAATPLFLAASAGARLSLWRGVSPG